jgi:hypothetical protein
MNTNCEVFSHKGNANQNNIEFPSQHHQNSDHQENKQQMLVKMQGERKLYTLLDGI